MKPIKEMSETEVRLQLRTLRDLMVGASDLKTASAPELRAEVRQLQELLGNAMMMAETLRLALAQSQSEVAALRGELQ